MLGQTRNFFKTPNKAKERYKKAYVIVHSRDFNSKVCILVGRHSLHGFGTFPGGTQDVIDGGCFINTIKREFREETGVDIAEYPNSSFIRLSKPEEPVQIYRLPVEYSRLVSICAHFSPQKRHILDAGIDLIAIMEAGKSLQEVFSSANSDYFHEFLNTIPGVENVFSKYTNKTQVADAWMQVMYSKETP